MVKKITGIVNATENPGNGTNLALTAEFGAPKQKIIHDLITLRRKLEVGF